DFRLQPLRRYEDSMGDERLGLRSLLGQRTDVRRIWDAAIDDRGDELHLAGFDLLYMKRALRGRIDMAAKRAGERLRRACARDRHKLNVKFLGKLLDENLLVDASYRHRRTALLAGELHQALKIVDRRVRQRDKPEPCLHARAKIVEVGPTITDVADRWID